MKIDVSQVDSDLSVAVALMQASGMFDELKAPFPAFGGKSRIAAEVWARLDGDDGRGSRGPFACRNFVEPFARSAAVLLRRPGGGGAVETINDLDPYIANFWRAVWGDPDAVAEHADWPVNETDLHARHRWLVGSEEAVGALGRVREDPSYFDARIAGWWCWGACCWIGSGWCDLDGGIRDKLPHMDAAGRLVLSPDARLHSSEWAQMPHLSHAAGEVKGPPGAKRVKLSGNGIGTGVCSGGAQVPRLSDATGVLKDAPECQMRRPGLSQDGWGVNADAAALHAKRPVISGDGSEFGRGVHGRPQLADQFARGRGVNGNDRLSRCDSRRAWLTAWMYALRDRLRPVRVCCGHWDRVCDSPSTMTRLGVTGVFLDPPYRTHLDDGSVNRTAQIYGTDKTAGKDGVNALCDEVQAWCLKWGDNREVRIALCGLDGEYPEIDKLVDDRGLGYGGWERWAWKSRGGYGNRSKEGRENAARERVWFSPHCLRPGRDEGLFGGGA